MGGFRHLAVDALPEGWSADYFGNLVDFRIGRTPPRSQAEFWENGIYPWVSIADMTPHGTVTETKERVSEAAHRKVFGQRLVPAGSLLMSFKLTIGRVARLGVPAYHNEAIISFRPKPGRVHADFLAYYLASVNFADYQDTAVKGQTLNKGKLEQIEIAVPSFEEQQQIAAVLDTVGEAIEQQEQLLAITEELKSAMLTKVFAEGLDGARQKQSAAGVIPEHWAVATVHELLREPLRNGHSSKATDAERGVRTLTLTAVTRREFSDVYTKITSADTERVRDLWLESGDVLIERANTPEYVGLAALYEGPSNWAIYPDLMIRVRLDVHRMAPKFLAEFLITDRCRSYFRQSARSTTGNFPKIDQGTIERMYVPCPPLDEQERIVDLLRSIDARFGVHKQKVRILRDLFRTLLHQLMTAQLRVHDLDLSALDATVAA